ncbi:MAG: alpha/beta hydrolase family protein [Acidimicrobiales bacterium]
MHERAVRVSSAAGVEIAAVLCLPEDALAGAPVPAFALIAGSGADTRDGDLVLEAYSDLAPAPGTVRRVAHHLAHHGVASLRWDRRAFGSSGGDRATVSYDTDLEDAVACFRWLQSQPEVDGARVGVAGHSAGALVTCRVCREVDEVKAAALLGALSSPIEDMLRWNVGRVARHWDGFTDDQRAWLQTNMPATLARSAGMGEVLAAATRGDPEVTLEGHGITLVMPTARLRQDLATSYEGEMGHVRCPALVLHGGDDLNVPVDDALTTYRALRAAGNDNVELRVIPGLDHYFNPVPADPTQRVWNRVSQAGMLQPMAREALEAISTWAARVL